jgi:hypothetical protein
LVVVGGLVVGPPIGQLLLNFTNAGSQQQKIVRSPKPRVLNKLLDAFAGGHLQTRLQEPNLPDKLGKPSRYCNDLILIAQYFGASRFTRLDERHRVAVLGKTFSIGIPKQYRD